MQVNLKFCYLNVFKTIDVKKNVEIVRENLWLLHFEMHIVKMCCPIQKRSILKYYKKNEKKYKRQKLLEYKTNNDKQIRDIKPTTMDLGDVQELSKILVGAFNSAMSIESWLPLLN